MNTGIKEETLTVRDVFNLEKIAARVAKGMQFATERGFISNVDVETLDMGKNGRCMLGQGMGSPYYFALEKLGISDDDATDLGFQCSDFEEMGVKHDETDWRFCPVYLLQQREFALLTDTFRQAIADLHQEKGEQ